MLYYYRSGYRRPGKTDTLCDGRVSSRHIHIYVGKIQPFRTPRGYHMETLGENVRAVLQGFKEWHRE